MTPHEPTPPPRRRAPRAASGADHGRPPRAAQHAGLALLATLALACSAPVPPAVLDDAGASLWKRVESQHFVVESNLDDAARVRRVAGEFEALWAAFASVPLLGRDPPVARPLVVVLRSKDEYRYVAGKHSAGLFMSDTALGPLILLPPNSGAFGELVVKHELAHFVAADFLADAPEWLAEGMAMLMETARYERGDDEVLFGDFHRGRVNAAGLFLPTERVLEDWPADLGATEKAKHYARSWLLVHYLVDHHLDEFLVFLVEVSRDTPWRLAWRRSLPIAFEDLDALLSAYHRRAKYGLWTTPVVFPSDGAFEERAVSPSDALALRAFLHASSVNAARTPAQRQADANADLRRAWELDPNGPRARELTAHGE